MMDLINYKDTTEELAHQINEIYKEMDYRRIELVGANTTEIERFDKAQELLCRDIIYNYLKAKIEKIKAHKKFIEIYGVSIYEAERQYNEWAANAITKKED